MKARFLSKKEVQALGPLLSPFSFFLSKKDRVEIIDGFLIRINGEPLFFYYGEDDKRIIPTLLAVLKNKITLPKVIVDFGAVPFVSKGADVMRPGVVSADEGIKEGDFVVVVEERHKKPLAVGVSIYDREEMLRKASGKVVKNLHYVGDKIWKEFLRGLL